MRKPLDILLILVVAGGLMALPATAAAEYLIPDGNSAVNQYTEGIPTGGGDRDTEGSGEKDVKPAQTIGAKTTRKLQEKGAEGRAAAELAAETAPAAIVIEPNPTGAGRPAGGKENGGQAAGDEQRDGGGSDDASIGVASASGGRDDGPNGSSALGEIIAAATGGADGGVGLLLPLAIVAVLAWGVAFAFRNRDPERTSPQQ